MKAESLLFKVVIGTTQGGLATQFIAEAVDRTSRCVQELLAVAGYYGELGTELDKEGRGWLLAFRVTRTLSAQLNLFAETGQAVTTAQAADQVVETAVIALARFHREVQPVIAAQLHETLKDLKSADPRVIAALARQQGRKLTLLRDEGELDLKIQTQSHRSLSTHPQKLFGYIVATGYEEMSVVPINRRSRSKLCIHPVRVRIPRSLRDLFDPEEVLQDYVKNKVRLELVVLAELVVRKRQHLTYELVTWPPPMVA